MPVRALKNWGWKRDFPHPGDYRYRALMAKEAQVIHPNVTENICPDVKDQGDEGACASFLVTLLMEAAEIVNNNNDWRVLAPQFLYYLYRDLVEQNIYEDTGAFIRELMKVAVEHGVCVESLHPFKGMDNFTTRPSQLAYLDAQDRTVASYYAIGHPGQDRAALKEEMIDTMAKGYGFGGGLTLFTSFLSKEVARTGLVPLPGDGENLEGGHALYFHDYDLHKDAVKGQNQWGLDWGLDGHFWIPFDYLLNPGLASDFWAIRLINE